MKDYPVIKIAILFILGIIGQKVICFPISILIISILFFLIALFTFSFFSKTFTFSLLLILIVIHAGALAFEVSTQAIKKYPFESGKIRDTILTGEIIELEMGIDKGINLLLYADSIKINNINVNLSHSINVKVRDDTTLKLKEIFNAIHIGDYVSLKGTISKARDQRNPGEFNYQDYLEQKNISAIFTCYSVDDFIIKKKGNEFFMNFILSIKKPIYEKITLLFDKNTSALMKGLLIGDRSELDDEIKTSFINTGIVHILAVSGMHVVYILLIITLLSGRFNFYIQSGVLLIVLILFAFITNLQPSVIRAIVMALVVTAAFLTNRNTNIFNSLAISALIILIFKPNDLFNPGFQLSFAAVISIATLYKFIAAKINLWGIKNRFMKSTILLLVLTFAAQIGTLPLTMVYFHKLSLLSIIANLIAVPLAGIMVWIGVLTIFLSSFWLWAAKIYASVLIFLTNILFWFIQLLSSQSISFIPIRQFSIYDSLLYYAALVIIAFIIIKSFSRVFRIVSITMVLLIFITYSGIDNKVLLPDGKLSVVAIDVGQGDAFLLKFPDGKTALIDAGESSIYFDNGEKIIMPLLDYLGIDKIDYAFISHIDSDHYSGFISLVINNKIREIYKPSLDTLYIKDTKLERFLSGNGVKLNYYDRQVMQIGGARIYILNKREDNQRFRYTNDKSGILKVVYGNNSFLFTGDAENKAEKYYIKQYGSFLKSDLLKLGHHGSYNSTSENFLNQVLPRYSLISAGYMNKFNHPSPVTLSRIENINSKVLRTDLQGGIILVNDGKNISEVNWRRD